jgi:hypothetical protein
MTALPAVEESKKPISPLAAKNALPAVELLENDTLESSGTPKLALPALEWSLKDTLPKNIWIRALPAVDQLKEFVPLPSSIMVELPAVE